MSEREQWSPELQAHVEMLERMRRDITNDPSSPQGLVGSGQSGSLLDYQMDTQIGTAICAEQGHRWGGENPTRIQKTRFCTRCGIYQHKETGEYTRYIMVEHPDWAWPNKHCGGTSASHDPVGHSWRADDGFMYWCSP